MSISEKQTQRGRNPTPPGGNRSGGGGGKGEDAAWQDLALVPAPSESSV